MSAGPPVQLTAQVRTDAPDPADPAEVVVLKGPLPPFTPEQSTTGKLVSIPASVAPVTLLAANANRHGFSIYNSSNTDILYVKASTSAGTVSSAFFTVAIYPQAYYEDPYNYVGAVTGVWSGATGAAMVDEYS